MKQLVLFLLLAFSYSAFSQLATTNPVFPTTNDEIIITYHADEGSQGLKDYAGDIYAHAGLITENSASGSDWKYVVTNWAENTPETKLTKIDDNIYTLKITPNIIGYYGVPETEKVLQMAFVFRNEDGSIVGKTADNGDIFIDVYEAELNATILKPESDILIEAGTTIQIEAAANFADSLILYVDNKRIESTSEATLFTTISAENTGKHWIWVEAKDETNSAYDSVYYYIQDEVNIADLPEGAHNGINYIDDHTVTLVLHAPEKEFAYLIGDFNDWDIAFEPTFDNKTPKQVSATTWMMNMTPDSTHHWITLTDIEKGKEYAFQYFIDGEIKVADPYTEKVLDPWNDHYISDDVYPNLKPYPAGKTSEPVSVFQTGQTKYEWQTKTFEMPAVTDMVIYEMLIRDFVATHSYKTIADTLDYLQNLGVNVLELMPINEFEGNSSWGYNPSFYFAPDKYYGPKNELKRLVDECHARGMAVVIDMVLNHSYGQSPFVRMYMENGKPAPNNPWYNVNHNFTNPAAQWGFDFNHESLHTQELVDSINAFWMSEYNVDGFRFDFTKGFGNNIKDGSDEWASKYDADRIRLLKRMADEIWKRNPDAFISFEHLSENSEEKELANYGINLWGNMNHAYNEGTMGYNESGKSNFTGVSYQSRGWDNPNLVGYMESHDEERLMFKNITYGNSNESYNTKEINTGLKRVELAANFFFTVPGPKMIWQFGELGYDISINEDCRVCEKPIKWEYFDEANRKRLYDVFGALAELKTTEEVFRTDDYTTNFSKALKSLVLRSNDANAVVVGNFDLVQGTLTQEFPSQGIWYEFYTGTEINVDAAEVDITLNAGEYRLYTTKKLDTPDITPSVSTEAVQQLNYYPNPVNETIYFETVNDFISVSIYTIDGKLVKTENNQSIQHINVSELNKGLYIILGNNANGNIYTSKFIKE